MLVVGNDASDAHGFVGKAVPDREQQAACEPELVGYVLGDGVALIDPVAGPGFFGDALPVGNVDIGSADGFAVGGPNDSELRGNGPVFFSQRRCRHDQGRALRLFVDDAPWAAFLVGVEVSEGECLLEVQNLGAAAAVKT